MTTSKKASLKGKIPGEFKKKKIGGKLQPKSTPYTSLTQSDIREIISGCKDPVFDFTPSHFQLDSDSFLSDPAFSEATELDLSGNCLIKFTSGPYLSKLKHFAIENNSLVDFSFTGLKGVVSLSISRNRIQNLNDMTDLMKLVNLDLSHNRITKFSYGDAVDSKVLRRSCIVELWRVKLCYQLTPITTLFCSNSKNLLLGGWHQLQKLKNLKVLDLGNCRIDLPPAHFHTNLLLHLKSLTKLQFLNLSGNPVETSIPEFRYYIIQELTELKYYNWDMVTKEDRLQAQKLATAGKWKDHSTPPVLKIQSPRTRRSDRGGSNHRRTPLSPSTGGRPQYDQVPEETPSQLDLDSAVDAILESTESIFEFDIKQTENGHDHVSVDRGVSSSPSVTSKANLLSSSDLLSTDLNFNINNIDRWLEDAMLETPSCLVEPEDKNRTKKSGREPDLGLNETPCLIDFDQELNNIIGSDSSVTTSDLVTAPTTTAAAESDPPPAGQEDEENNQTGKPILLGRYRRAPISPKSPTTTVDDEALELLLSTLGEEILGDTSNLSDSLSANVEQFFPPINPTIGNSTVGDLTAGKNSNKSKTSGMSLETYEYDVDTLLAGLETDSTVNRGAGVKREPSPNKNRRTVTRSTTVDTATTTDWMVSNVGVKPVPKLSTAKMGATRTLTKTMSHKQTTSGPTSSPTATSLSAQTLPASPKSVNMAAVLAAQAVNQVGRLGTKPGVVQADVPPGTESEIRSPKTKPVVSPEGDQQSELGKVLSARRTVTPRIPVPTEVPKEAPSELEKVLMTREIKTAPQSTVSETPPTPKTSVTTSSFKNTYSRGVSGYRDQAERTSRAKREEKSDLPVTKEMPTIKEAVSFQEPDLWDAGETEFALGSLLGKGTYGVSYLGQWRRLDGFLVIKKLHPVVLDGQIDPETAIVSFKEECKKLIALKHPNLTKIVGAAVVTLTQYVFMEYFEEGMHLQSYIKDQSPFQNKFIVHMARTLASALAYLHKEGVIHGALKSYNVFIDKKNNIQLMDYGFMDIKDGIPMEDANPEYWAPELFRGDAYKEMIDVYAYGMILYEMLFGKNPFQGVPVASIMRCVGQSRKNPPLPRDTPPIYGKLIQQCWNPDPGLRPDFVHIQKTLNQPDLSILPDNRNYPIWLKNSTQRLSLLMPSSVTPSVVTPSSITPSVVTPSVVTSSVVTPSVVIPSVVTSSAVTPSVVTPSAVTSSVVIPSAVTSSVVIPSAVTSSVVIPSAVTVRPSTITPSRAMQRMTSREYLDGPVSSTAYKTVPPSGVDLSSTGASVPPRMSVIPGMESRAQQGVTPRQASTLPRIPSKPEAPVFSPKLVHKTFMSPADLNTQMALFSKLSTILVSNITVQQVKAINTLAHLASIPGKVAYIATNDALLLALCGLLSLAGQHVKIELVEQAIQVITDLGSDSTIAERVALPQYRTLVHLINILSSNNEFLINKAAKALQVLAVAHPPNADAMRLAGALPHLLSLLRVSNPNHQTAALVALMGFLLSPKNVNSFLQTPGFADLITLAKNKTGPLKLHAMEALMYFVGCPQYPTIEELNLKDIFLRSLSVQNQPIKEIALRSLTNITQLLPNTLTDPEKILLISECLKILAMESQILLIIPAIRNIFNLINATEEIKAFSISQFHINNGVGCILPVLMSPCDDVRLVSLQVLEVILEDKEARNSFITMGGVALITNSLGHWNTRIRQLALATLLKSIRGATCDFVAQTDIVVNVACILGYIGDKLEHALAADIICEIAQMANDEYGMMSTIIISMRENGVMESLLRILGTRNSIVDVNNGISVDTTESAIFAIAVLSNHDLFRPVLVQNSAFFLLTQQLKNPNPSIQERVAWTLSNLGTTEYGSYMIGMYALSDILDILVSQSDQVVSSALRAILSVVRKSSNNCLWFKQCDPSLSKLKAILKHPSPSIQGVAYKLVEILSKNLN